MLYLEGSDCLKNQIFYNLSASLIYTPRHYCVILDSMKNNIVIDPKTRFGKPIIRGTRITVDEVIGALVAGMDFEEIEQEYGLNRLQIQSAIRYVAGLTRGEQTIQHEVSA